MVTGRVPLKTQPTMETASKTQTNSTEAERIAAAVQRLKERKEAQAREDRENLEEFARYKAAARTETELARVKGYEAHLAKVEEMNRQFETNGRPHRFKDFQWRVCVLCRKEITDDPYGHNAAPLAEGKCCAACNEWVLNLRLVKLLGRR